MRTSSLTATRWTTTLSPKVNSPYAIDFRAQFGHDTFETDLAGRGGARGPARRARSAPAPDAGQAFGVWGSGFGAQGLGFGVQGAGFGVQGSGSRVQGLGFRDQGSGLRVQGSVPRVQGSGFRVQGSELRV